MMLGAIASAAGMGLLAVFAAWQGLRILLAATAMRGVGYSLLFLDGLAVINGAVPTQHRGGGLSAKPSGIGLPPRTGRHTAHASNPPTCTG